MSELANDEFDKDYWFEMYQGQCEATDEWAKKYRDEVERKADATLLARCEELQRIAEVANAMVGKERDQTMRQAKRITELEASLADSNEALQVMGLKLEQAEADTQVVGDALCKTDERLGHCLTALRYYASGDHFIINNTQLWDTVSGEPQNFWCDEAGSATVEDGRIAALTLQGNYIDWTEGGEYEPPKPLPGELDISVDATQSPSANTVGGPTPGAAPACERKE